MGPKQEMVPLLWIVREGIVKEATVEVGLERMSRSSPDEWGPSEKPIHTERMTCTK